MEHNLVNRSRFQFSLRTALLLIVLTAAGASIWTSVREHRQIERLRADNTRLRNEVGEIEVGEGEENKLHAIRIPSKDAKLWQWRVFVPAGRQFHLNVAMNQIPSADKRAVPQAQLFIPEGYSTISLQLQPDQHGSWKWIAQTKAARTENSANDEIADWAENAAFGNVAQELSAQTNVEPGRDLQLLRLRLAPGNSANYSQDIPTAGSGVLVWISEP
jgi:hypothetical protein